MTMRQAQDLAYGMFTVGQHAPWRPGTVTSRAVKCRSHLFLGEKMMPWDWPKKATGSSYPDVPWLSPVHTVEESPC